MSSDSGEVPPSGTPSLFNIPLLEAYGWKMSPFPGVKDQVAHVEATRKLRIRDDDVLVAAFPKCGTHWLWEVTQMLLRQTTDYEKRTKEQVMLESPGGLERADQEPSPRILNSHNPFVHLPQEIISKKTKIIHVIRNPKDTAVSAFWHTKTIFNAKELQFQELLDAVMGQSQLPTQFDYLQQMSEFERTHPDHPIKHEPVKIIKELAQFLNVPASDEFCQDVANACSFDKMKKIEETGAKDFPKELNDAITGAGGSLKFYRKGIIGDWKNMFTVAQNETFDAFIDSCTKTKGLNYAFIFE
ncbi:sulfotransferase 1A1-like isoform X2 [Biomphalaria pfeifferi]|uniref:Sulfotransferase 1A1-like isoform X2 n=1 Tax=Biomphalaria pfeifferi TaxID=112525 RepID=A0AAD8BI02_BIOPF|nr:sulfotransferase 1A1-like isoform X2 [Biomphalaria pfeifferi]